MPDDRFCEPRLARSRRASEDDLGVTVSYSVTKLLQLLGCLVWSRSHGQLNAITSGRGTEGSLPPALADEASSRI
jgi:hypothetical protein